MHGCHQWCYLNPRRLIADHEVMQPTEILSAFYCCVFEAVLTELNLTKLIILVLITCSNKNLAQYAILLTPFVITFTQLMLLLV